MLIDLRLAREDLAGEHPVHLVVAVGARVGEHGEPVVEIGRLPQRRQHDPAGRDAGEHERVGLGARSSTSRSLPLNALTRRLTTIGSPGRGSSVVVDLGRLVILGHRVAAWAVAANVALPAATSG